MCSLFFCVSEGKGRQGLSWLPFAKMPLSTYFSTASTNKCLKEDDFLCSEHPY